METLTENNTEVKRNRYRDTTIKNLIELLDEIKKKSSKVWIKASDLFYCSGKRTDDITAISYQHHLANNINRKLLTEYGAFHEKVIDNVLHLQWNERINADVETAKEVYNIVYEYKANLSKKAKEAAEAELAKKADSIQQEMKYEEITETPLTERETILLSLLDTAKETIVNNNNSIANSNNTIELLMAELDKR